MNVSHRTLKQFMRTQHLCQRKTKYRATKILYLTHSSPAIASLSTRSTSTISQASQSLWGNSSLNNRMKHPPKISKKLTIILIIIQGQPVTTTKTPALETETRAAEMDQDLVTSTTTLQPERTKVWTSASSTRWLRTTSLKTLSKQLIKLQKLQFLLTKLTTKTNRLYWSNLNLMRTNWSTPWGTSPTTKPLSRTQSFHKKTIKEWDTTAQPPALDLVKSKIDKLRISPMFHKLKLSNCVNRLLIKWHKIRYRQ